MAVQVHPYRNQAKKISLQFFVTF